MATNDTGPGPGIRPGFKKSYAQMVGGTLPSSWKKNILEIVLEKDERKGSFYVSETDCSKLLVKLGIDPRPGSLVESVQICPTGRGLILITFRQGVDLEQFSRYDVIEVTRSGVRAVHIKPAGKRDVVVTLKGLHPNTRDDGVMNYLGKYGKIVTNKVVYGTYGDGPLKGVRNGDRSYKMEIKPDTNIGTYHAIDGQRVTVRYSGQLQTCARCFETAVVCRGGAIARRCEAAQGTKVEFSDFVMKLWDQIGYVPGEVEMAAVYDEHNKYDEVADTVTEEPVVFTPAKQVSDPDKFSGVSIRQFPRETDHGDIMEFLVKAGMPDSMKDTVEIKNNGSVTLKSLDNAVCLRLIGNIHNKVEFGKKLFCNGIIALTPEKDDEAAGETHHVVTESQGQVGSNADLDLIVSGSYATSTSSSSSSRLSLGPHDFSSNNQLVRRYSLSLTERPPACSIAADIMNTRKSLLADINDLKDQLSEFGSCVSEVDSSEDESKSAKKRNKGKRKAGKSPLKSDEKLKKPALVPDWFLNSKDGLTQ